MTVVYILWMREVKKYLRSRTQMIASLGSPLMYLGVLGFGLGPVFRRAGEGSYLQFMAPGVIGMTVLFTAMFSGIALLWDRQFGFLKETLVAPVPRLWIMIGRTLGGATVALLQGTLIFVFCLLTRLDPLTYGVDGLRAEMIGMTHFGIGVDVAVLVGVALLLLSAGAWRFSKIEI